MSDTESGEPDFTNVAIILSARENRIVRAAISAAMKVEADSLDNLARNYYMTTIDGREALKLAASITRSTGLQVSKEGA
jgi:hypothetical protein